MPVTDRDLEGALRNAALIVEQLGEQYWPVFERLESELEARTSRKSRVAAYLQPQQGPTSTASPSRRH